MVTKPGRMREGTSKKRSPAAGRINPWMMHAPRKSPFRMSGRRLPKPLPRRIAM